LRAGISALLGFRRAISAGYLPTIPQLYQRPDVLKVLPIAAALRTLREPAWVVRPSTIAGSKYAAVSKAYYLAVHEILASPADPSEVLTRLERTLVNLTGFRTAAPRR
jgi:trehalose/maltose transport system substrate-binding protein